MKSLCAAIRNAASAEAVSDLLRFTGNGRMFEYSSQTLMATASITCMSQVLTTSQRGWNGKRAR